MNAQEILDILTYTTDYGVVMVRVAPHQYVNLNAAINLGLWRKQ
jgi:hypothetical protein